MFPFLIFYGIITTKGQKSITLCERGGFMIDITTMAGKIITLNCNLIETVEETPDTVIKLTSGKSIIVRETRQEVKDLVKSYHKEILSKML